MACDGSGTVNVRRNATHIAVAVLMAALFGGLTACSDHHTARVNAPERVTSVSLAVAQKSVVQDWLEAVGTVHAEQTSQVASQMMGTVVAIRAHEGDRVQVGQVLAVIDDSQPRAAVQQSAAATIAAQRELDAADTELTLATATLKRYQPLYEKGTVSPREFDEIKARRASAEAHRETARARQAEAEAALTQARNALGYTQIHAPFAGIVTEKKVDVGTMAAPGMPIFTVEDTRRYRLEATIDERDIGLLQLGLPVSVFLDAFGDAEFRGTIVQIVPAVDPASRGFLVKIELPVDARLRSGLFGRAQMSRGQRTALLIPKTALIEQGQLQGAYVVDPNGEARLCYLTLGKAAGQRIEVLSGIREGEILIAAPGDREWAGKQVALTP